MNERYYKQNSENYSHVYSYSNIDTFKHSDSQQNLYDDSCSNYVLNSFSSVGNDFFVYYNVSSI